MPRANKPADGPVDSWGRRCARKHADRPCVECRKLFHPGRPTAKYCSRPCADANNGGRNRIGKSEWTDAKGYRQGYVLDDDGKRVRFKTHRAITESHLGRKLLPDEDVHHINGDKSDNRIENLQVVEHGAHTKMTNAGRTYKRGHKIKITEAERERRSRAMRKMRREAVRKAQECR